MARKTANTTKKREVREQRQRQRRNQQILRWSLWGVLGLAIVGALVWFVTRPVTAMGDEVVINSRDHVPEGSVPGPFQSDPPAGGTHYPNTFQPGFYEESQVGELPIHPEGYLVHNLEHGYIIFWYNCAAETELSCDELKATIREVMDSTVTDEEIAFPWASIEEPLVITSWGRIMRFPELDTEKMREFVRVNLNKSPEPDAR